MRIGEYKQIDVEITEVQMPILDDEGNETGEFETITKETPIMGMVYRDATPEEMSEMQKSELEQMMEFHPATIEEKIQMLAEQITEELPEGTIQNRSMDGGITLPFKVGYRWERKLVGNTIVYESVQDPHALGTVQNPIYFTEDSPLIDNAFYIKDGVTVVYMSGEFISME